MNIFKDLEVAYLKSIKELKGSQIESLETKIEWLDEICKLIKLEGDPELTIKLIRVTQKSLMSLIDTLKKERETIVNAHA